MGDLTNDHKNKDMGLDRSCKCTPHQSVQKLCIWNVKEKESIQSKLELFDLTDSIDSGGGADTRFEFHIAGSVSSDLPSLHPGRYSVLQYYILVRGGD